MLTRARRRGVAVVAGTCRRSRVFSATTTAGEWGAARWRQPRVGVSFDIDGVLLRGYDLLPGARESLLRLSHAGIPYIFLTNGGGETEASKAAKLAHVLGVPVVEGQVVLSHTPLKPLIQAHAHEKLLILGCRDVMSVARSYGGRRLYDIPMLAHDDPLRYPFIHFEHRPLPVPDRHEPFGAVFILHDPNNWGAELQITMDVIRGGFPFGVGQSHPSPPAQAIPVYASNPDLVFAGSYPVPRLACGAFTHCLKALFREVTGSDLHVTQYGKPTRMTFQYAQQALVEEAVRLHGSPTVTSGMAAAVHSSWSHGTAEGAGAFTHLFHIGDNPAADMRGALNAGDPWHGILVRTGVFKGPAGSNDPHHPGHLVVGGVADAVDHVMAVASGRV